VGVLGLITAWVRARAEQNELDELSDQQLKDIGLSRDEVTGLRTGMFGS
jgi:uncharacterized protein YjiS (DUF1127 family)